LGSAQDWTALMQQQTPTTAVKNQQQQQSGGGGGGRNRQRKKKSTTQNSFDENIRDGGILHIFVQKHYFRWYDTCKFGT
jgi:hypothetical protein